MLLMWVSRHAIAPRYNDWEMSHSDSLRLSAVNHSSELPAAGSLPGGVISRALKRRRQADNSKSHDITKMARTHSVPELDDKGSGVRNPIDIVIAWDENGHAGLNADTLNTPCGKQSSQTISESAILAPHEYVSSMPSKGVRTALIDSLNVWVEVGPKQLDCVKDVVKMLHNSSLILDDIEDGSRLRRSCPAAHAIYGTAQSINSATFVYVRAVQKVLHNARSEEAMPILLTGLERLFIGQSWDLYWSYNIICPSEEAYLSMVDHKTGALFCLLTKLMQAYSPFDFSHSANQPEQVSFDNFGRLFGRFFQIRDDYPNLTSSSYTDQKGYCEDFDEGKISYLIVHCLQAKPQFKDSICGIFRQRTLEGVSTQAKEYILKCLRKAGSLEATKSLLNGLEKDLEKEIGKIEDLTSEANPMLRVLVKSLSLSTDRWSEDLSEKTTRNDIVSHKMALSLHCVSFSVVLHGITGSRHQNSHHTPSHKIMVGLGQPAPPVVR